MCFLVWELYFKMVKLKRFVSSPEGKRAVSLSCLSRQRQGLSDLVVLFLQGGCGRGLSTAAVSR